MHIGIDILIEMMPPHLNNWESGVTTQGFWWKKDVDDDGNPIQQIQLGSYAIKVSNTLRDIVTTMAANGHNVIIAAINDSGENGSF